MDGRVDGPRQDKTRRGEANTGCGKGKARESSRGCREGKSGDRRACQIYLAEQEDRTEDINLTPGFAPLPLCLV